MVANCMVWDLALLAPQSDHPCSDPKGPLQSNLCIIECDKKPHGGTISHSFESGALMQILIEFVVYQDLVSSRKGVHLLVKRTLLFALILLISHSSTFASLPQQGDPVNLTDTTVMKSVSLNRGFSDGLCPVHFTCGRPCAGYVNAEGFWEIEPKFWSAYPFYDGVAVISLNFEEGLIDKLGKFTAYPLAARLSKTHSSGFIPFYLKESKRWGYVKASGDVAIPPQFLRAGLFHSGIAKVQKENKLWGYVDRLGRFKIPAKYEAAEDFHNGFARVYLKKHSKKQVILNRMGNVQLTGLHFRGHFADGLLPKRQVIHTPIKKVRGSVITRVTVTYGFVDKKDKYVIKPIYHNVGNFSEGLAVVQQAITKRTGKTTKNFPGNWGVIDKKGTQVFKFLYENLAGQQFSDGMLIFKKGDLYGYLDRAENVVFPAIFTKALPFNKGMATAKTADGWCFLDKKGNMYNRGPFIPKLAIKARRMAKSSVSTLLKKRGMATGFGSLVKKPLASISRASLPHTAVPSPPNELKIVEINEKYGFVNKKGQLVVPADFETLNKMGADGFTTGKKDGKFGLVFPSGTFLPTGHEWLASPSEGLVVARLKRGSVYEYIDKTGKCPFKPIWKERFTTAKSFENGRAMVSKRTYRPGGASKNEIYFINRKGMRLRY